MTQRNNNMETSNIMKTRELDLCVSCEICLAVCPEDAITMEYKLGQFLPTLDDEKCAKCGLCLEICPGIDIDPFELRHEKISDNTFAGPCLESYTAYSNDPDIRKNSASGGLITNLITELIKNKDFDAAFILDFDKFDGKPARLKATDKINEILKAAKSKYIPASVYNVIKVLEKGNNRRYIIVGTPCQIYGIKKFIKNFDISEENYLFLGLFCEKALNFNIIRYFEDAYRKPNENLIKFHFKTKEKYGWPGNSKVYFDSGTGELTVDAKGKVIVSAVTEITATVGGSEFKATQAGLSITAGGQSLKTILTDLINAITAETHGTAVGPTTPPINVAQYLALSMV